MRSYLVLVADTANGIVKLFSRRREGSLTRRKPLCPDASEDYESLFFRVHLSEYHFDGRRSILASAIRLGWRRDRASVL